MSLALPCPTVPQRAPGTPRLTVWASAPTGRAIVHGLIHEGSYGEALNLLEERTRA